MEQSLEQTIRKISSKTLSLAFGCKRALKRSVNGKSTKALHHTIKDTECIKILIFHIIYHNTNTTKYKLVIYLSQNNFVKRDEANLRHKRLRDVLDVLLIVLKFYFC